MPGPDLALVGVLLAAATGLLVWGQAQTMLRDGAFRIGTIHFWLGIALTAMVAVLAAWRARRVREQHHTHGHGLLAGACLALVAIVAQGYLGGRMTYDQGVGVSDGGQLAQTAVGARRLELALAGGTDAVTAGREAFSTAGLGCASCHGALARGERGPRLAGGRDLADFRNVHAHGLFPPSVVGDRSFAAVNAWLTTLAPHTPH